MANKKKSNKKNSLVSKQFGDYKLTEAFAVGGMSQIYKGEDINLGRTVAVKVLTPELLEMDDTLVERFQREAKAVAALEHENIITIYQYGEQDDHYFLAMKLIQGEDLADILNGYQRKGKLMSPERMLNILQQVASALDYAHEANVIHRDIKPSNILLDKNDKAILTDFGLVLRNDIDQTMGTAFGTPRYISPEQALASEQAVPQSDIYSLAVIVYEILTGEMIYKADTAMGFALSHISEPPPPPRTVNPDIPRSVERELLKALDKSPNKRHKTASQFIKAVRESYGNDLPTEADGELPNPKGSQTPIMAPSGLRNKKNKEVEEIASRPRKEQQPPDTWTLTREEATPIIAPDSKTTDNDSPTLLEKDVKLSRKERRQAKKAQQKQEKLAKQAQQKQEKLARQAERKRRRNLPLGILSIIVICIALYSGYQLSDLSDEDTNNNAQQAVIIPSETPDASVPLTLPEGGEEIIVHYDFNAITLYNDGETELDMTNLTIEGPGDTSFTNANRFTTVRLSINECILIRDDLPSSNAPDDAICSGMTSITLGNRDVFWRDGEDETTFSIMWNEIEITSCDTVGRNDSDSCTFIWPDIEE